MGFFNMIIHATTQNTLTFAIKKDRNYHQCTNRTALNPYAFR